MAPQKRDEGQGAIDGQGTSFFGESTETGDSESGPQPNSRNTQQLLDENRGYLSANGIRQVQTSLGGLYSASGPEAHLVHSRTTTTTPDPEISIIESGQIERIEFGFKDFRLLFSGKLGVVAVIILIGFIMASGLIFFYLFKLDSQTPAYWMHFALALVALMGFMCFSAWLCKRQLY